MGKYRAVRDVIVQVLADNEWHTTDELQEKCETEGMIFEGERGPIYNIVYQLKKKNQIEADGNGKYRMYSGNLKKEKMLTQELLHSPNKDLMESISSIEMYLEKYRGFNWIKCSEEELREARTNANKLIELSEQIKNEFIKFDE